MDKLYANESNGMRRLMIDIGILPSLMKSLTKFFTIWGTSNARVLRSIQDLLITISFKSLSSTGNISVSLVDSIFFSTKRNNRVVNTFKVVWDLLNGLSFMEDCKTSMVQRCLRATQAVILTKLLESFFPTERSPSSTKFKFNG